MIKKITIKIPESCEPKKYWQAKATRGNELIPLKKPCRDCAVEWGLYSECTEELKLQPRDIQIAVSKRWSCHNNTKRACAGNYNRIMGRK